MRLFQSCTILRFFVSSQVRLYFQEENENLPYKSPYTGKKRPAFGNVNYLNANFKWSCEKYLQLLP